MAHAAPQPEARTGPSCSQSQPQLPRGHHWLPQGQLPTPASEAALPAIKQRGTLSLSVLHEDFMEAATTLGETEGHILTGPEIRTSCLGNEPHENKMS